MTQFAAVAAMLLAAPGDEWKFTDVNGDVHSPFADGKTNAAVLVFISPDCPIANAYHPELRRLQKEFTPKGFDFFLLHPDPDVTAETAKAHVKEFGVTAPVVLDAGQKFTKKVGAKVTPEAAVIDPDGKVLYLGRIDDLYVAWGKKRRSPTKKELHEALSAIADGKPVPVSRTKPVGCYIPEIKSK